MEDIQDSDRPTKRARLDGPSANVQGLFEKLGDFDKPQTESDCGITQYVEPGTKPIHAIIKHRFTDFLVHEVDLQGNIVKLTSLSPPPKDPALEQAKADEKALASQSGDVDWKSTTSRRVKEILGDNLFCQLQALHAEGSKSKDTLLSPAIDDKEERTVFHKAIREMFSGKIITETQITEGRMPKPKDSNPPYLHFTLHKFNRETNDALGQIATILRVPLRNLAIAGTKDKRSASTQRVSLKRQRKMAWDVWDALQERGGKNRNASASGHQNRLLKGMRVGNFVYDENPLELGKLSGNRFTVTLSTALASGLPKAVIIRDIPLDSIDLATSAIESVKTKGFVNYFGMQRFGTTNVPSSAIGLALLRSEWSRAAGLIMREKPGDPADVIKARQLWLEKQDATAALKSMPKYATAERALLAAYKQKGKIETESDHFDALQQIPKKLKMMYIHAYQSYLWNVMVSERMKLFGSKVVIGDLVYANPAEQGDFDLQSDEIEMDTDNVENAKEEDGHQVPLVKVLEQADLDAYSIFDIVLPLPGHVVSFPVGPLGQLYRQHMQADSLDPDDMKRKQPEYSMAGTYRKILCRPTDVKCSVVQYDDPDMDLALTDEDLIFGRKLPEPPSEGKYRALQVELTLGSSIYATMALREILKCDTTMSAQRSLTQEMLAKHAGSEG